MNSISRGKEAMPLYGAIFYCAAQPFLGWAALLTQLGSLGPLNFGSVKPFTHPSLLA